ncbi:MAG: deoxyguanosinetriphosphate triphosphohydrolase [Bifidobacteriaceae bacterium]|jgi:dGTPase|nr:deoxyguanosinetriphosphate triphosphohydrolase [Bifidobacteriaceae bacterium]
MYSKSDIERFEKEVHQDSSRSEFERDRARVLYSQALRRLGDKTQVLVAGSDDYVRTRLTHSLEVAQVGRQLALRLKTDPNVVEAACLAHDIGHPPFGHNGESVLNNLAKDIGGFEGNAQTFRLLTFLEPKEFSSSGCPIGLNLTRTSLDACIKYPWDYQTAIARGGTDERDVSKTVKFNVYNEDLPYFNWVRQMSVPLQKSVEAQIMDLSDDISYCVHDFEDAVALGNLNPIDLKKPFFQEKVIAIAAKSANNLIIEDYENALKFFIEQDYFDIDFDGSIRHLAKLKNITSSLIGHFVISVAEHIQNNFTDEFIRYSGNLQVPKHIQAQIELLKSVSIYFVMSSRDMALVTQNQESIIKNLVDKFMRFAPEPSGILEPIFKQFWLKANNDDQRLRVAIDQVASLTDTRAKQLVNSVF